MYLYLQNIWQTHNNFQQHITNNSRKLERLRLIITLNQSTIIIVVLVDGGSQPEHRLYT